LRRVDPFLLRKLIPSEEFDYTLLCGVLSAYSGVRQKIHELLEAGVILRVKKGLYVFGSDYARGPVCREVIANWIYGPSCISLEYALSHHGFIPEQVYTVTSVTPKRDKAFATPLGSFTYRYLRPSCYPHGIEQVWIDSEHPTLMASPEKALCDYVVLRDLPALTRVEDAREFLRSDLRIDPLLWSKFNTNNLAKLNTYYQSQSIEQICGAL